MPTKRLLVLDLNGTILHRLTHAFETKLFKAHPVVVSKKLKPDITVRGSKIVFRPHSTPFLVFLLKHFDVAVWTSSRPQNALPMVHQSFKNLLDFASILEEAGRRGVTVRQIVLGPSEKGAEVIKAHLLEDTKGKARLKFIWTQSECDTVQVDDEPGETVQVDDKTKFVDESKVVDEPAKTDTNTNAHLHNELSKTDTITTKPGFTKPIRKKNLTKIYDTFPQHYTPSNTLIIDDTPAKLQDHRRNHLQIEEFTVIKSEVDFTADGRLLQLKKYLERLVKEDPEDLRTFLENYDLDDF